MRLRLRLGVGMVSSRVIPDTRQAEKLRRFFDDALLTFGEDLQRWRAMRKRWQPSPNQAARQHEDGDNRHRPGEQGL